MTIKKKQRLSIKQHNGKQLISKVDRITDNGIWVRHTLMANKQPTESFNRFYPDDSYKTLL